MNCTTNLFDKQKEKLQLRYYQNDAVDSVLEYVASTHNKHPIIVLPTGSGKSAVQAELVDIVLENKNTRVLCVTHSKKLIQQNHDEFFDYSGFDDTGIYSAGLKRRDRFNRVLFAGIQSIHGKSLQLGCFDLIIVDEAHLINSKQAGIYRKFLKQQQLINPNIVIIGMSATPYRMTTGLICEGKEALFDDICYEISVKQLIQDGFLSPVVVPKYAMQSKVDMQGVHKRGGEWISGEMERAYNKDELVTATIKEIIKGAAGRKKILVFSSGIEHAEHIYKEFKKHGESVGVCHSGLTSDENDATVNLFETGQIRFLVNAKMFTTGFNVKDIDCLCLLFSTMSPGLYVQIIGRGTRLFPGKTDCLVLDFGNNIKTHGAIDKIEVITREDGKREVQTAPEKECPICGAMLALAVVECLDCGHIFERELKHDKRFDQFSDVISKYKKPEIVKIDKVSYYRHTKKGSPDSVRVDYYAGFTKVVSEWVCIEHTNFAKQKALSWLQQRGDGIYNTVDDILDNQDTLRKPTDITIDLNGKYTKIIRYNF